MKLWLSWIPRDADRASSQICLARFTSHAENIMRLLAHVAFAFMFGLICSGGSTASGQVAGTNNPYQELDSGKGTWPPFYKPDTSDAAYSKLMADGMCKPNGKRARNYYLSKMVDVSTLPEFSFEGKISTMEAGGVTATDNRNGEKLIVIVHESPAISRVNVKGSGTLDSLTVGSHVRFVGRVDASGACSEKIDQIELISPSVVAAVPVEPNKLQSLSGKIVRRDGNHLVVLAAGGKVRRLSVELSPSVQVSARLGDYHFAKVGDTVKMKGRILRMTTPAYTFCFADDLEVDAAAKIVPTKAN
jgi:hypothetical protein